MPDDDGRLLERSWQLENKPAGGTTRATNWQPAPASCVCDDRRPACFNRLASLARNTEKGDRLLAAKRLAAVMTNKFAPTTVKSLSVSLADA